MMDLTERKRELLSGKILDLGNIAIAALVFGQLLQKEVIDWWLIGIGSIIILMCYYISLKI